MVRFESAASRLHILYLADFMRVRHSPVVAQIDRSSLPVDLFFEREAPQWSSRYLSRTYQERRNLVLSIIAEDLSKRKNTGAECTALDFGCGAGVLVEDLSRMGIKATGVDRSPSMIEAARSRLGSSCNAELELLGQGLNEGGAYRLRAYNLILCLSVLEFVASPGEIIAHLADLLAVGGLLILTVPNRSSYFRRLERFGFHHPMVSRWLPRLSHLARPDCYLHHQKQQFTAEELVQSAKQLGLDVEQHRFHVAPRLCGPIERFEKVGMMILMSFRKSVGTTPRDAFSTCDTLRPPFGPIAVPSNQS